MVGSGKVFKGMEMNIRFASIPKCASRSLKELGLLGEVDGRCHTKIIEYPDYQNYKWFAVDRPEDEWFKSWWYECRDSRSMFGQWLGFKYQNIEEDKDKLKSPPLVGVPLRWGLNQWIKENFTEDFLKSGLSLKEFCFNSIIGDVPCERININELDAWLINRGIDPVHKNARSLVL